MDIWITPKELASGMYGFPKIPILTQANLRAHKKLTYTLIANKVLYKQEWIEDYINSNIRPAKIKEDEKQ